MNGHSKPPLHLLSGINTPEGLAHFIRASLHMQRRANDNNRNMPATDYEG